METLQEIHERIRKCRRCRLSESRRNPVPGEGNEKAKVMFVGEAPGYWEDVKGRPFVGRAGKLLDTYLEDAGLRRKEVYITNVVKCRPPQNRTPWKDEIEACLPYLRKQIELIDPSVIVTLGNTAGETVFRLYGLKWRGITQEHGKIYRVSTVFGEKILLPMFHPAAVLRRRELGEEMRKGFARLGELIEQL